MTKETTVKELEAMIANCFELKVKYDEQKAIASATYADLEQKKAEVIGTLENLGMTKYKAMAGSFSYKEVSSFKVPKGEDNRAKFFTYLKNKGVYEGMITVNSRTLNSWAQLEETAAEEKGEFDFQIPGLEKTDPVMKASMTKARA